MKETVQTTWREFECASVEAWHACSLDIFKFRKRGAGGERKVQLVPVETSQKNFNVQHTYTIYMYR